MKLKIAMNSRYWFFICMLDVAILSSTLILSWFVVDVGVISLSWILGNFWFWIAVICTSTSLFSLIYLNWNKIISKAKS